MIEGKNYIYDRFTNSLYPKVPEIINKINYFENRLEKFKKITVPVPYDEGKILKRIFCSRPFQITINITEKCNCDCKYCIYGENYPYSYKIKKHKTISFDIIKKAAEYFKEILKLKDEKELYIGFYGGEPTLEWRLIEEAVKFFKYFFKNKALRFSMTTNFTRLTKKMIDFLIENNFFLTISIDGPREENDRFRNFKNGKGVFDVVYNNIVYLQSNYPLFFKHNVNFSSVYCEAHDLNRINDFFLKEPFLNKSFLVSKVSEKNSLFYKKFISKDEESHFFNQFLYLKGLFFKYKKGELKEKKLSKYILSMFNTYYSLFLKKRNINIFSAAWYIENDPIYAPFLPASCFPLGQKIYVSSEGKYYICEKISERIPLGDVYDGIKFKEIHKLIERYLNDIARNCLLCNYIQVCPSCFATLYDRDKFSCENVKVILEKQFLIDYISGYLNIDF